MVDLFITHHFGKTLPTRVTVRVSTTSAFLVVRTMLKVLKFETASYRTNFGRL